MPSRNNWSESETSPGKPPSGLSQEELEAFYHEESQAYFSLSNAFPALVRQTAFVYLYSILEKGTVSFSVIVLTGTAVFAYPTPTTTLGTGESKRLENTCKKLLESSFSEQSGDWNEICCMNKLRKPVLP